MSRPLIRPVNNRIQRLANLLLMNMHNMFHGGPGGTRTLTPKNQDLNLARMPISPRARSALSRGRTYSLQIRSLLLYPLSYQGHRLRNLVDVFKIRVTERTVVRVAHAVGRQHERHRTAVLAIPLWGFDLLRVCCHGNTVHREFG